MQGSPKVIEELNKALREELRTEIRPSVASVRIIDTHPEAGKVYVNLINANDRLVMSLDMWRRGDGIWVAQQWNQCID